MEKNWYVYFQDHHKGPYSQEVLRDLLQQGVIQSSTQIWSEGLPDWIELSSVGDLVPAPAAPVIPPPITPKTPKPQLKNFVPINLGPVGPLEDPDASWPEKYLSPRTYEKLKSIFPALTFCALTLCIFSLFSDTVFKNLQPPSPKAMLYHLLFEHQGSGLFASAKKVLNNQDFARLVAKQEKIQPKTVIPALPSFNWAFSKNKEELWFTGPYFAQGKVAILFERKDQLGANVRVRMSTQADLNGYLGKLRQMKMIEGHRVAPGYYRLTFTPISSPTFSLASLFSLLGSSERAKISVYENIYVPFHQISLDEFAQKSPAVAIEKTRVPPPRGSNPKTKKMKAVVENEQSSSLVTIKKPTEADPAPVLAAVPPAKVPELAGGVALAPPVNDKKILDDQAQDEEVLRTLSALSEQLEEIFEEEWKLKQEKGASYVSKFSEKYAGSIGYLLRDLMLEKGHSELFGKKSDELISIGQDMLAVLQKKFKPSQQQREEALYKTFHQRLSLLQQELR